VGQGDEVPTAPVTVAVSLADKLDTLISFFTVRLRPTGSRDPFALRRAALGAVALILTNRLRFSPLAAFEHISDLLSDTLNARWQNWASADFYDLTSADPNYRIESGNLYYADQKIGAVEKLSEQQELMEEVMAGLARSPLLLTDFFADRLKVQQREAGVRHDLIDAVFALGGEDDLVRLLARVRALQGFVETAEGRDLLAGYKRAANILKKEGWSSRVRVERSRDTLSSEAENPAPESLDFARQGSSTSLGANGSHENLLSYTPENEEAQLIAALDAAEPKAAAAIEAEDFEGAMAALASLRAPVDAFFDKVTVNDPDAAKREARLALLARMRDAVHRVADFSKIEG
jgi:glycyl-tRNA synthetase beta chain